MRETGGRPVGGRPIALPMLDIHTVGAGGGSIAWRDAGGALRVGPRSAGARPGPARLRPRRHGADRHRRQPRARPARHRRAARRRVALDADAARDAVGGLGERARPRAAGVRRGDRPRRERGDGPGAAGDDRRARRRPARPRAARVRRRGTAARGRDRRGARDDADPLPARVRRARRARPRGLRAPPRRPAQRPARRRRADRGGAARGDAALAERAGAGELRVRADLRYRGQAFELTVDADRSPTPTTCASVRRRARARLRLPRRRRRRSSSSRCASPPRSPGRTSTPPRRAPPGPARETSARTAWFDGEEHEAEVIAGEPAPGAEVTGPAICELPEATLAVPPGWAGRVEDSGTIRLERAA